MSYTKAMGLLLAAFYLFTGLRCAEQANQQVKSFGAAQRVATMESAEDKYPHFFFYNKWLNDDKTEIDEANPPEIVQQADALGADGVNVLFNYLLFLVNYLEGQKQQLNDQIAAAKALQEARNSGDAAAKSAAETTYIDLMGKDADELYDIVAAVVIPGYVPTHDLWAKEIIEIKTAKPEVISSFFASYISSLTEKGIISEQGSLESEFAQFKSDMIKEQLQGGLEDFIENNLKYIEKLEQFVVDLKAHQVELGGPAPALVGSEETQMANGTEVPATEAPAAEAPVSAVTTPGTTNAGEPAGPDARDGSMGKIWSRTLGMFGGFFGAITSFFEFFSTGLFDVASAGATLTKSLFLGANKAVVWATSKIPEVKKSAALVAEPKFKPSTGK